MSERERTIIRVVGLAVHAAGFLVLLAGVGTMVPQLLLIGVLSFVIGGAWGWGMVLAAARRDAADRQAERDAAIRAGRPGFTARFDDDAEPPRPTLIAPPPGGP